MKRRHTLPRRFGRYEVSGSLFDKLARLSARQQYIAEQSIRRYEARHGPREVIQFEIGTWQGFRIITSELPHGSKPPGLG